MMLPWGYFSPDWVQFKPLCFFFVGSRKNLDCKSNEHLDKERFQSIQSIFLLIKRLAESRLSPESPTSSLLKATHFLHFSFQNSTPKPKTKLSAKSNLNRTSSIDDLRAQQIKLAL
jgi:hypothetical protein